MTDSCGRFITFEGGEGTGKSTQVKMLSAWLEQRQIANLTTKEPGGTPVGLELRQMLVCGDKDKFDAVAEALLYYARLYKVKNYKYEVEKIISQFEMNTWQDRKIEKLSGGMARKAMIARALLVKPKILLLDEPSVGLDPDVRYDIWQEIKKLKNMGISVIITTHYMEEAEYLCDKIAILKQGELLAIDEVEKIKQIMQKDENEDITLEKAFLRFIGKEAY